MNQATDSAPSSEVILVVIMGSLGKCIVRANSTAR
jgi:hypothetical protein